MFYKEKVEKRVNDFDAEGNILPWVILDYFENVANNQLKEAEKDIHDGLVWVMTEWRIEVEKYPARDDEIFATTWAVDDGSTLQTKREFLLTDENGHTLVKACGYYILFDLETQRISRISKERAVAYQPEKKQVFEDDLPRQKAFPKFNEERKIAVRKSDIDSNSHVHNTKYLEMALEIFDGSYCDIKFIRITYRAQIRYGDEVLLRAALEDGEINSALLIEEKPHAFITIKR